MEFEPCIDCGETLYDLHQMLKHMVDHGFLLKALNVNGEWEYSLTKKGDELWEKWFLDAKE